MKPEVYLIGVGMGGPGTLTLAARAAIDRCAVLVGAPRLLEPYGDKPCRALIAAGDILAFLKEQERGPVGVLLSGDVGFYSGAAALRPLLEGYEVRTFPGISSLVYFCAALGTSWQDVHVVSAHGRAHDAPGEIQCHEKTFVLTGGKTLAHDLCRELCRRGLGELQVAVGERLSYPDERIVTGTARELSQERFGPLAVVLAVNPHPVARPWNSPGLPDDAFERGQAPMTKGEVRALAICKLRLAPGHVLWDVGAGTGSVSVEGALAVPAGRVYAIEKKPEALELLERNRAHFGLANLEVVAGTAPEVLEDLPAPDRVFLGGTSGDLEAILKVAFAKNPTARVVCTAVTLETVAEAARLFAPLAGAEMVQLAVTRTRTAGPYHLMDAQNPVWIFAGEGPGHEA